MRDDITMLPKMQEAGWEPIYSYKDKGRKDSPHDPISFQKGNRAVWKIYWSNGDGIIYSGWQSAELINNSWTNHLYSPNAMSDKHDRKNLITLEEVLKRF